jgi:hypothetical protein
MARRKRSYTSAANKGKGAEVFWNNRFADAEKARKKRQKEKEREKRAALKEQERKEKLAQQAYDKEQIRLKKQQEKLEREEQKRNDKIDKYFNRLVEVFLKKKLILTDNIATEIIGRALKASITIAQLQKHFVDGEEDIWVQKASHEILENLVEESLLIGDLIDYTKTDAFNQVVKHLTEEKYCDITEVHSDTHLMKFLESVRAQEEHQKMRNQENEKVSSFVSEVTKSLVLIPEDEEKLLDFIDADEGKNLTVEIIKESEVLRSGIERKKTLVSELDKKIDLLLTS